TFFAAGQGTSLSGQLNQIYTGFSKAGAALALSSDDMQGIFLALGQSMSKGKVQAEELRGQIGERLPGAFQIAAKAMGVSTAELDKMMADGKLLAEDLLPKMAQALEDRYGKAAESAADTVQAAINRMDTAWTEFKAGLMSSGPAVFVIKIVTDVLEGRNAAVAKAKQQASLDKELERIGARKSFILDESGTSGVYGYTDAQRQALARQKAMDDAANRQLEQSLQKQEQTLTKGREAITKALKETTASRRAALEEEKADALKAIDEMVVVYRKQGTDVESLLKERERVVKAYDDKLAALGKKAAGPKSAGQKLQEKIQRQVAGFAEDTRQLLAQVESLRQSMDAAGGNLDSVEMAQAKAEAGLAKKMASNSWQSVAKADPLAYERRVALEREKIQLESRQKIAEIEKDFLDDARETLNDGYEQERAALDAKYELYKKHVTDKSLVDQWYEQERRKIDRDPWSGVQRSAEEYFNGSTNWAENFGQLYTSTMDSLLDASINFSKGSSRAFADMGLSFANTLGRMTMQAAASGLFKLGVDIIGGFFGGGSTTAKTTGSTWSSGVSYETTTGWHRGGLVGADAPTFIRSVPAVAFAGAPRLHSGGGWFRSDEYPAILQRGERVLSRAETRAYHAGMGRGGAVVNNIVVQTPDGYRAQKSTTPNNQGGEDVMVSFVEDIVARKMGTYGSRINRAMQQQGSRMPVMRGGA
ncbi:MAG: tape measure protein, partial [Desulfovibrio piger]|uniref:tape measure protein n=1 Tax=Desulfovibrio piger TaxID=901 RepID=UPI002A810A6F